MKKLLFGFLAVVLMGAGCASVLDNTQDASDTTWWLSFDLPEDWVLVGHYGAGGVPTDEFIEARSTDIVLQNTALPISLDGEVSEEWDEYVSENYTYIRVFRYSVMRPVPDDVEDLGNGFYEQEWYGLPAYWYPMEFGNYLFTINSNGEGQDMEEVKEIIFSAKENNLTGEL